MMSNFSTPSSTSTESESIFFNQGKLVVIKNLLYYWNTNFLKELPSWMAVEEPEIGIYVLLPFVSLKTLNFN